MVTANVYLTLEIYIEQEWKEVKVIPLEKICVLLGRNQSLRNGTDICIDDSLCASEIYNKISGVHLTFYRRSITEKENHRYQKIVGYSVRDGYKDRKSTNGTLLNGSILSQKTNLADKDILQLGSRIRLIYHQKNTNNISDELKGTYTGD